MILLRAVVSLSTLAGLLLSVLGAINLVQAGDPSVLVLGVVFLLNALLWHVMNHIVEILTDMRRVMVEGRATNPNN